MTHIALLIPVALFLGLLGMGAFIWSVRQNQYSDMKGAAERILLDDDLEMDESPRV